MIIYYNLMNILVMPYFIVMKMVFLVYILTMLVLITLTMMKIILKRLFKTFIRLLAWHIKFKKLKTLKNDLNKELMLVAWHPRSCWNFRMSEDEKKAMEPIFKE